MSSLRIAFPSSIASEGIVDRTSSVFATQMYWRSELVVIILAGKGPPQLLVDGSLVLNVFRHHEESLVCSMHGIK